MGDYVRVLLLVGATIVVSSVGLQAQTAGKPSAPATHETAAAPMHDLSGVWNMHPSAAQGRFINSTYSQNEPAMTPWAAEKYKATKPSNGPRSNSLKDTDDPVLRQCLPPGTPRIYLQPFPLQIIQTPKEVTMLFEYDHTVRHIFIDGRPHPADVTATYMGHSIGKWDGDTLVVDTVGFNDKTWLDRTGHQHSPDLHVVEHFKRVDRNNFQVDISMEDPKALLKPWTTQLFFQLKPDWDIMEQVCTDNGAFEDFEK